MEAKSADVATAQLRSQGIIPSRVKEKPKDIAEIFTFLQPKVTVKDLVVFTRQFSVMVDAGLPLVQCLHILGEQQENSTFKRTIEAVRADVESGSTFAEALGKPTFLYFRPRLACDNDPTTPHYRGIVVIQPLLFLGINALFWLVRLGGREAA